MPHASKRKLRKILLLALPTIVVVTLIIIVIAILRFLLPLHQFLIKNNISPKLAYNILTGNAPPIKQFQGRTNIVVLGISGGERDGADLTDTIMFFSIDMVKKDVVLVSVPRDLWIPTLKAKINTAYHYGEEKKPGEGGLVLAKSALSEALGQPVAYAVLLNFADFKTIIDTVGGVDVNVQVAFEDDKFPIPGKEEDFCAGDPDFLCRYEHIRFDKGVQHMVGETALKYVRSRQAHNGEGTDFARGRRQQEVLLALKEKLIERNLLKNPNQALELLTTIDTIVKTDMTWAEKIVLGNFFVRNQAIALRRISLDSGDTVQGKAGYLINPPLWAYNGVWVLVPRTGDFAQIHEHVACQLRDPACTKKP